MIALVSELMALVALAASILCSIGPEEALIRAVIAYFTGRFVTAFWIGMIEVEKDSFTVEALPSNSRNSKSRLKMILSSEQLLKVWSCFFEKKDEFSRSLLITHYSYLVKITVSRLGVNLPGGIDREDLIGAGIIGLIKSVEQFDPLRDVKFETYAIALIRGAVLEMLREEDWVPRSIREKLRALDQAQSFIEIRTGRTPTVRELSDHLGLSDQEINVLQTRMKRTTIFSLDDTLQTHDSDDTLHFIELIVDENTNPLSEIEGREIRKSLHVGIDTLPERERVVITLYYYESLTFREIGKVLGVSESRVYQLHNQAMNRLKEYLHEQSIIKVA